MIQLLILGPSGIGKTHWGPVIASDLNLQFLDLDLALNQKHTCTDLAGALTFWGLPLFYQRSISILSTLTQDPKTWVVAVGAGTQMAVQPYPELLLAPSLCLWAPPEWLWKKNKQTRQDPRSLEQFAEIEYHPRRKQLYQRCRYFIDLSKTTSKITLTEILKQIKESPTGLSS